MSERQAEDQTEDLCIHVQGLFFDGSNTYIEVPTDGEWHHIVFSGNANEVNELSIDGMILRTLSEDEVREAYSMSCGWSDRELPQKELEVINELLANHPEIKSWWIKNNVLYLVMEDEEEKK